MNKDSIIIKIKKLIIMIGIVLPSFFINNVNIILANNTSSIISEDITKSSDARNSLAVSGSMPRISNHPNTEFQNNLNKSIKAYYDEIIKSSQSSKYIKKLNFVHFSTENKSKNTKSIIVQVTTTSSVTRTSVKAFTFDDAVGRELSFTDDICLGVNGVAIAGDFIKNTILNEPDKYNVTFTKITDNKNFYIEDNKIYIIYSDYKFEMRLDKIHSFSINKNEYEQIGIQKTRMIPIRKVVTPFDYRLIWNKVYKSITVRKGDFIASFSIGSNIYKKGDTTNKLEQKAIIDSNGDTLVPITFFDKVLGMYYTINANGSIIFSYYG